MKLNEINDPIKEFLEKNRVKNYKINTDGTIDVDGDVDIITKQSKLPVKFERSTGDFYCGGCKLTSLEGTPRIVSKDFDCNNNKLTSLEGAPSYVGGIFYCTGNKLTSLHNIHKFIKEIKGMLYCRDNPIENSVLGVLMIKGIEEVYLDNYRVQTIINKHLSQGRAGVIDAQQELLDAGLDEYAKL